MEDALQKPELAGAISGFVFRLTADRLPLEGIAEASQTARILGARASLHLRMFGSNPAEAQEDDAWVAARLAEAVLAAAAFDNVSVYADTFVDNDRGYFVRNGVLDRLCNPRPAFHVVRNLSGLLNDRGGKIENYRVVGAPNERRIAFETNTTRFMLSMREGSITDIKIRIETDDDVRSIDLISGEVTHK